MNRLNSGLSKYSFLSDSSVGAFWDFVKSIVDMTTVQKDINKIFQSFITLSLTHSKMNLSTLPAEIIDRILYYIIDESVEEGLLLSKSGHTCFTCKYMDSLLQRQNERRLDQIASQDVIPQIKKSLEPVARISRLFYCYVKYAQERAIKKYDLRKRRAVLSRFLHNHHQRSFTNGVLTSVTDRTLRYVHTYEPWPRPM